MLSRKTIELAIEAVKGQRMYKILAVWGEEKIKLRNKYDAALTDLEAELKRLKKMDEANE